MSLTLSENCDELRNKFLGLKTPRNLAELLDLEYKQLVYHLYKVPESIKYSTFEIPKKSGGVREISAPVTALKIIQQKLNQVLQCVYEPKASVHGYIPNRSIITNANVHLERKKHNIFNVDLLNFFPSIHFGRVRGMFINAPYNLDPEVATVLAKICCFNNGLPQGAPSSPIISNMICSRMDSQLLRFAQKNRSTYSRYADDMTFSTSLKVCPSAVAGHNSLGQLEVGAELKRIIVDNGFQIHPAKISLRNQYQRQEITGIIVNEFPNVRRKYVRQIRAMLHAWKKFGYTPAEEEFLNHYDKKHRSEWKIPPSFRQVVKGKIEYLGMVRGKNDPLYHYFCKSVNQLEPGLINVPADELDLLLETFESLELERPQKRGYILESLLKQIFEQFQIRLIDPFRRNRGAEQIDGAFEYNGWHYIVECRYRKDPSEPSELDAFYGKVNRSGRQTMVFFLSINGWSNNVPNLLKQNPTNAIILMNGDDLRCVLDKSVDLNMMIDEKISKLNVLNEPYYGAKQLIDDMASS